MIKNHNSPKAQQILEELSASRYADQGIQSTFFIPSKGYWTGCFGYSTTEPKKTIKDSTLFGIGSLTKTITAMTTLRLIEMGKLSIEDKISQYLDADLGLIYSDKTTIRHLLNHTSDLPDYSKNEELWTSCFENLDKAMGLNELISWINASPRDNVFGEFHYNGSNYYILGIILKKRLGVTSLSEVYSQQIFQPFKLKNSFIAVEDSLPLNRELCCDLIEQGKSVYSIPGGGGQILSNSFDLTSLLHQFFNSDFLSRETKDKMLTFNQENYGLGIQKIPFANRDFYGHDGAIPYSSGMFFHHPESNITGSFLCTTIERQYAFLDVMEEIFGYFVN
ncbi:MAG: serine hydrolase [Spirochaetaceae bacterium]|jgi:D-alanyl-D-alanine carboxypeptidase|nr:serine hydrolase [Spirochaetaceae bacterium]